MKAVPGYEGLYCVTEDGRVWSERSKKFVGGYRARDGYVFAVLMRKYHRWYVGVHRLVALAFIGNPGAGLEINHKNGVRDDNRIENLEWVTHIQNCKPDRALNLIASRPRGEKNGSAKYTDDQINEVRVLKAAGYSQTEISAQTGISQQHVSNVLSGKKRSRGVARGATRPKTQGETHGSAG